MKRKNSECLIETYKVIFEQLATISLIVSQVQGIQTLPDSYPKIALELSRFK